METVGAGDICAAVGFKEIRTGDTLCAENAPIVLEQMTFPEPVIGLAVEPEDPEGPRQARHRPGQAG